MEEESPWKFLVGCNHDIEINRDDESNPEIAMDCVVQYKMRIIIDGNTGKPKEVILLNNMNEEFQKFEKR